MRAIGQLPGEQAAILFVDYLYARGIRAQLEFEKESGWAIWVHDEDRLSEAAGYLEEFRKNPADPQFALAAKEAPALRAKHEKQNADYQKRLRTPDSIFKPVGGYRFGALTAVLIGISVVVFLITKISHDYTPIAFLLISEYVNAGLQEVRSGQVWRLLTPIFLHFNLLHILFNMMWLADLGSMIEGRQSSLRLGLLVLVIGCASNLGQYLVSGPVFGGMSGVVYGLLGYVWIRGKFDPASGLFLHQTTVIMMLVWFFICFTGWVGAVANTAHAVGLGAGMVWGYLSSRRFS